MGISRLLTRTRKLGSERGKDRDPSVHYQQGRIPQIHAPEVQWPIVFYKPPILVGQVRPSRRWRNIYWCSRSIVGTEQRRYLGARGERCEGKEQRKPEDDKVNHEHPPQN